MQQPTYLRRLLNQKVLLIIGFIIALVAGLFAGFTINEGEIEPRATRTFMASSTVLLTSTEPNLFRTEIPGTTETIPVPDPNQPTEVVIQAPTPIDLSESAILLAYLASSDAVVDAVETSVGGFEDGDAVTAVRRTTQPAGDEQFGGRLSLPIIDIVGVSTSAERAELIAAETTGAFSALVQEQQDLWGVTEDIRLNLEQINAPVAGEPEGSNPAIPVIVVAVGVFLFFIALALIIEAIRDRRRRRGAAGDDGDAEALPSDDAPVYGPELEQLEPADAGVTRRRPSRRRSASEEEPVHDGELVPQGAAHSQRS